MKNYKAIPDLLSSKVILVTGAGQGIGRVAAITYAAHGATVILHGRDIKKLESVYDEIEQNRYPKPSIFPLDFQTAGDAEYVAMAQAIKLQLGKLDGILHNASMLTAVTPLESQTLDQWLALLRVNLAAPFALTRACLPLLKQSPSARIIMTCETHGHTPSAYWGGFAVAKSGLEALVKIAAHEWEIYPNLRINGLVPGPVNSPQRKKTHPGELLNITPESLMPYYLYLMGHENVIENGYVIECALTASA